MDQTAEPSPASDPDLRMAGLSLWVFGRQFPNCDDYYDGNWLVVRAQVKASGAVVECEGPLLHTSELNRFAQELATLKQQIVGSAELACMEPNLNVRLEGNRLGHIAAEVSITPDHLTQSHRFTFEIDQSYLGSALASCETILGRFPVVGLASA